MLVVYLGQDELWEQKILLLANGHRKCDRKQEKYVVHFKIYVWTSTDPPTKHHGETTKNKWTKRGGRRQRRRSSLVGLPLFQPTANSEPTNSWLNVHSTFVHEKIYC